MLKIETLQQDLRRQCTFFLCMCTFIIDGRLSCPRHEGVLHRFLEGCSSILQKLLFFPALICWRCCVALFLSLKPQKMFCWFQAMQHPGMSKFFRNSCVKYLRIYCERIHFYSLTFEWFCMECVSFVYLDFLSHTSTRIFYRLLKISAFSDFSFPQKHIGLC